jgi:hypothetical protein
MPSVLKLKRLGVVVMKQKMPRTTTTTTNSKDLFRISSLQFIFANGLAKKSLLGIMLIGIAQIKVYLLWKKPKPL